MPAAVELFSFEGCPFAQRCRIALIEKQVDFTLTEIDLYNRPAWFREVSPYGKVPVLRHEGHVIYESAIINQYLDEAFPGPPLMPPDPHGRAQARIWMDYCDSRLLPATQRLMAERDDAHRHPANLQKLAEVLRFIEHEGLAKLGADPFWMGAAPMLPDCHYMPFFERFSVCEDLAGASWPGDCTRLRRLYDAMAARASFAATRHTPDFHIDHQLKLEALRRKAG